MIIECKICRYRIKAANKGYPEDNKQAIKHLQTKHSLYSAPRKYILSYPDK